MWIVLFCISWVLEIALGWVICSLLWGATILNGVSLAAIITANHNASAQFNVALTHETITLWTPQEVIITLFLAYLLFHVIWSACAWFAPGIQRYRSGAREPSQREREIFETALARIGQESEIHWLVVDKPGYTMRWVGYTLLIDRQLLSHQHLTGLLAHELGQYHSSALLVRRLYILLPGTAGLLLAVFGFPIGIGRFLTQAFWMRYFRKQVFAADRWAVEHGQGIALSKALEDLRLSMDRSTVGGRWLEPVPHVEQRIDRLAQP